MPNGSSLPENPSTQARRKRVGFAAVCGLSLPILGAFSFEVPGFLLGLATAALWGFVIARARHSGSIAIGCTVVFCIGTIGLILENAFPPRVGFRETAMNVQCKNNMKQIILALHNYHDAYGSFPPPVVTDDQGQPLHSWRVLILPYLHDGRRVFDQYDMQQPWDSPANLALKKEVSTVAYTCPFHWTKDSVSQGLTNYFLVTGDHAASLPTRGRRFADFSDGTGNTIMLIESSRRKVPWMQPWDFTLESALDEFTAPKGGAEHHSKNDFSIYPGYCNVAMVDGSVKLIAKGISRDTWSSLLTIDDGGPDLQSLRMTQKEFRTPNVGRWVAAIAFVLLSVLPLLWIGMDLTNRRPIEQPEDVP